MKATKQQILEALSAFARQRSGIEFGNYGDVSAFRSEQRSITKDLHHARKLLAYVALRDSITADMLREGFRAYSGRLTLKETARGVELSYCTGQYFPTEYRKAVCAVLAAALWDWMRTTSMPAPNFWRVKKYGCAGYVSGFIQIHAACETIERLGGKSVAYAQEFHNKQTPGDYMRDYFKREFGRGISGRWFN